MGLLFVLLLLLLFMTHISNTALSRLDLLATNSIENEIKSFVEKKPVNWQQQVHLRINQLEKQYVPKGYSSEKVTSFKHMIVPPDQRFSEVVVSSQMEQQQKPLLEKNVEEVQTELNDLLAVPQEERSKEWKVAVNKHIFALGIREPEKAQEYLEEIYTPKEELITVQAPIRVSSEQESEHVLPVIPEEVIVPQQPVSVPKERMRAEGIFQGAITGAEQIPEEIVPQEPERRQPIQQVPVGQVSVTPVEPVGVSKEHFGAELLSQGAIAGAEEIAEEGVPQEPERIPVEQVPVEQAPVEVVPQEHVTPVQMVVNKEQKIDEISKNIDQLLALPQSRKTSAWEKEMEDLIFELSVYDKEKAHAYLKRIYAQISAVQPVQVAPITPTGPQQGAPLMTGGPKIGTPPPPPPGGKIAPKADAITLGSLRKKKNSELFGILDKHLIDLEKNWDDKDKPIRVPTSTGGTKLVVIHGTPEMVWENTVNTIKKVIVERKLLSEADLSERINKYIEFVRAEKIKAAKEAAAKEEKEEIVEEETQKDIEMRIESLLQAANPTDVPWLISIKTAIKKLNGKDHDAALKYQEDFIKTMEEVGMKEKRFIK